MKIAIFSDTHLGFDEKGERADESFSNLEQAIKLSMEEKADLMLLAGDIFDAPIPSHSVLYMAINSFSEAQKGSFNGKLSIEKNNEKKRLSFNGTPIITIHGNHEYRGKASKTALDVLNLAGSLIYFHAGKIIAEKDNEKIVVFGLGAVPEKKALEVLQYWNPKPDEGAVNLLLLHQGFKEFMAIDDEMVATLSLDDLPKGFDLIVDGHLHWNSEQNLGETTFILPGSTIATSIKKLECEKPKGVFLFDSKDKKLSFKALPRQRKMFYKKIECKNSSQEEILKECNNFIAECVSQDNELKPLIRINLKGFLKKGLSSSDIDLKEIFESNSDKALLSISKNFSHDSFKKKISELRELQKSKRSLASMGFELLEKNLDETDFKNGFNVKGMFDLLSENELDKALELLSKRN